jgi:drug/metabolite transporter (DMT)-like permease
VTAAAELLRANRRGIQYMAAAMACFVINDSIVKYTSQSMPATQLIFLRGLMASVIIFAVARATGATVQLSQMRRGWVAVRAGIDALGSIAYLVSLFHLPIANATAINMASPLFIALLAMLLLGERVDTRRWLAIGAGFAGVLMVIQPSGAGFNAYAWLCLSATVLHALRDLATRRVPPGTASIQITLATAIAVTLLAGALSLFEGWAPFAWSQLALLSVASAFLAAGYHLIIHSVRLGEISVIAPFRYTGLLCALVLGWLIWGDVPNLLAWAGIALLIGAGLYMLHRERGRVARGG